MLKLLDVSAGDRPGSGSPDKHIHKRVRLADGDEQAADAATRAAASAVNAVGLLPSQRDLAPRGKSNPFSARKAPAFRYAVARSRGARCRINTLPRRIQQRIKCRVAITATIQRLAAGVEIVKVLVKINAP